MTEETVIEEITEEEMEQTGHESVVQAWLWMQSELVRD